VSDVGGKDGRRDDAFYMNEVLPGPLAVCTGVQDCRANRRVCRYIRYTHVLPAEGDEIADEWIVVALDTREGTAPLLMVFVVISNSCPMMLMPYDPARDEVHRS
jgi:hypothetical protein